MVLEMIRPPQGWITLHDFSNLNGFFKSSHKIDDFGYRRKNNHHGINDCGSHTIFQVALKTGKGISGVCLLLAYT